jgi:hypothetical protein
LPPERAADTWVVVIPYWSWPNVVDGIVVDGSREVIMHEPLRTSALEP